MLRIDELEFAYDTHQVIRCVSFEAHSGEVIAVVGANGSGKTTLFNLITGGYKQSKGTIFINDQNTKQLSSWDRSQLIAYVPQNPDPPQGFTVGELVMMGRNPYLSLIDWGKSEDFAIAEKALLKTGLSDYIDQPLDHLSGGELQSAFIAMALAQETEILLLDEPTSNLDLRNQAVLMSMVHQLSRENETTVIMAMHDLTLAAQWCDKLVMLLNGSVFAEGPPEIVLTADNINLVYDTEVEVEYSRKGNKPIIFSKQN
ncbi:MAG: iron complex transport system ATP-binding protein [Chloroflexi bacterium]|jgi:iron complex transport system ATP-binding protein|nr:MAG: iron complex transport system ATP-binding protein [Chloroflexota bacterium]